MFSMVQTGGRLPKYNEVNKLPEYEEYPFPNTLHYANVCIFELDYGEEYLHSFDPKKLKWCSPVKRERENTGHYKLKPEINYVLIPATE